MNHTDTASERLQSSTSSSRWARIARHPAFHLALLLATLGTMTWAGAALRGIDLWRDPGAWTAGLPFALALLFILGVHEMGHYALARRHGLRVSLPYFVPVPFGLGTIGAFIRMESEPDGRRQLFDVAIAGPLAGLVASVAVLALGGSSLALAGKLGLLLTAFNLMPVGQLDGGHIARAWFGEHRARIVGHVALGTMVAMGLFVWRPMLLWAVVAFAFSHVGRPSDGDREAGPAGDLGRARRALGIATAAAIPALLLLTVIPATGHLTSCPWM